MLISKEELVVIGAIIISPIINSDDKSVEQFISIEPVITDGSGFIYVKESASIETLVCKSQTKSILVKHSMFSWTWPLIVYSKSFILDEVVMLDSSIEP